MLKEGGQVAAKLSSTGGLKPGSNGLRNSSNVALFASLHMPTPRNTRPFRLTPTIHPFTHSKTSQPP